MSEMIRFFSGDVKYRLREVTKLRRWISNTIEAEKSRIGEICFIFCSDDFLLKYNRKYLKHNTLTDIITFPAAEEEGLVSGDIYISLPRVKENARKYKQRFKDELNRVMIHGILHLIGYDDQKAKEKENMHKLEDHYLARLSMD